MMQCKLDIHSKDGELVCTHEFEMAGENRDRAAEYCAKTVRRRWGTVEWFDRAVLYVMDNDGCWIRYADFMTDVVCHWDRLVP